VGCVRMQPICSPDKYQTTVWYPQTQGQVDVSPARGKIDGDRRQASAGFWCGPGKC